MDTTEFQEKDEDHILPDSTITDKDLNILTNLNLLFLINEYIGRTLNSGFFSIISKSDLSPYVTNVNL